MRFFNTAGPCRPEDHHVLPMPTRLPELRMLIDQIAQAFEKIARADWIAHRAMGMAGSKSSCELRAQESPNCAAISSIERRMCSSSFFSIA